MKAIINRGSEFGTLNEVITKNTIIQTVINNHLVHGTAKLLIDTENTLMYELDTNTEEDNHFTNMDYEDSRQDYLATLSPYDRFERLVTDQLIEVLEITNGDAQGIVEVNEDLVAKCYRDKVGINETAQLIANV